MTVTLTVTREQVPRLSAWSSAHVRRPITERPQVRIPSRGTSRIDAFHSYLFLAPSTCCTVLKMCHSRPLFSFLSLLQTVNKKIIVQKVAF